MNSASDIPIIDLQPYFNGTHEEKLSVASLIDDACQRIGFLIITNHGISSDLIERVRVVSREFFLLPLNEKRKVNRPRPDMVRGYSGVAEESLSYSLDLAAPGDLKESFSIGPSSPVLDENDEQQKDYFFGESAGPHFAPNIWPTHDDAFKTTYIEYFLAMANLAQSLMRLFALALFPDKEEEETFFDDKIDKHISMFRTISYPPLTADSDIHLQSLGQLRASAHTDYGTLTIVLPDGPGLKVKRPRDGQWIDVQCDVPNAMVVNLGDLMSRWTNDRWVSTLHRVINPVSHDSADNRRRLSLVFFHQPNYDTVIECLPIKGSQVPPKYPPITSGDHLRSKFLKQTTFGGTRTTTT